jgi:hypothetical protein
LLVHQTGAGQGTGVTTNASFHTRRAQNLHTYLLLTRHSRNQIGVELLKSEIKKSNSKLKTLNSKQAQMTKIQNSKLYDLGPQKARIRLLRHLDF